MSAESPTELAWRAIEGDGAAWHALWQRLEPRIWTLTERWQVSGPCCKSPDDRRSIVLGVMAKLRQGGFRRLRAFLESPGGAHEGALQSWLTTITLRVAIDHRRAQPEHLGRGETARYVELVSVDDVPAPAHERDLADHATVLELLAQARRELSVEQLTALSLWLEGGSHADIAQRLGLPEPEAAARVLRAGLKRLRDRFRNFEAESEMERSS